MSYLNSINSYESAYNSSSRYVTYNADKEKEAASINKTAEDTKSKDTSDSTKSEVKKSSDDKIQKTLDRINKDAENAEKLFSALNSMQNYNYFGGESNKNNSYSNDSFNNLMSLTRDFSMMKTGSYYNILKNYYNNSKNESGNTVKNPLETVITNNSESTQNSTSKKLESAKLLELKDSVSSIKTNENSIKLELNSALSNERLNKINGSDDKGYMDSLANSIESFAKSYNSMIDSASETDSTSVLNNVLSLTKMTRYNATSLKEIGVTLGNDNKLTVDKDALKKADLDKINSMFGLNGSFGDYTANKADQLSSICAGEIKTALYSEKFNSISSYL